MNCYLYNVTIFDTAPDADLTVFPKVEPYAVVAENEMEAQRKIVEMLFDEEQGGVLALHSRQDDSATRFNIVFNDPEICPVEWDEDIQEWVFADDDVPEKVRAEQAAWASGR